MLTKEEIFSIKRILTSTYLGTKVSATDMEEAISIIEREQLAYQNPSAARPGPAAQAHGDGLVKKPALAGK